MRPLERGLRATRATAIASIARGLFKTDSAITRMDPRRTARWADRKETKTALVEPKRPRTKRTSTRSGTAMESRSGLMELTTKVTGSMEKLRARARFGMQREMSIEENSGTTWQTDTENIHILTDQDTEASSKTMFSKARVRKSGSMEPSMLVSTIMAKNTVTVSIHGPTIVSTRETGTKTKYLDTGNINGTTAESTPVTGLTTTCMARASTSGQMVESTWASTLTIKSKGTVCTLTPTEEPTKASGSTVSSTAKDSSLILQASKRRESGTRANVSGGWKNKMRIWRINEGRYPNFLHCTSILSHLCFLFNFT